jgi:ribosomal protein L34E
MATLMCKNKGCYKTTSDSLLDKETNEVICSECGKPIEGVTDFTKRSMIGLGKVRSKYTGKAYSVECKKCTRVGQPKELNGEFVCFYCEQPLELTDYFKKLLKAYIKKANV